MKRQVMVGILALSFNLFRAPFLFMDGAGVSAETGIAGARVTERKDQEFWIVEVLRLGQEIRKAEEDYEKFSRDCKAAGKSTPASACEQARQSLVVSEKARRNYQTLLTHATNASISAEWLKAHFTWVRWSPEWQRLQQQEEP